MLSSALEKQRHFCDLITWSRQREPTVTHLFAMAASCERVVTVSVQLKSK